MPFKMFCDKCSKETTRNFVGERLLVRLDEWKAEVMVYHNGTANKGILCEACLMQIIREGQEVPVTRGGTAND